MKNKVVTSQPLALLAKLAAVAGAIGGILSIHHPQSADRLVVLLVPGIGEDRVAAAIAQGTAPHLASLVATGLMAEVDTTGTISGLTFWRRALAGAGTTRSRFGAAGEEPPIWSELGDRAVAVGVPDALLPEFAGGREPAVEGADSAFVGGSAFSPVDGEDLRAGRLPAPFDAVAESVKLAAGALSPGRWSDWIEVGDAGNERLQVLQYDTDRYLLSPLYRTARVATIPPSRVVLSDPFVASAEPSQRPALVEHLVSVDETRALAVERLLRSSAEVRALFYAFTVGDSAIRLFDRETPDSSTYARMLEVLDRRLALVSAAASKGMVLVVIGGHGLNRQTSGPAWCLVSSGEGARLERARLDVPGLARLLRYLLGVPLRAKDREGIPPSLLARYPRRATVATATPGDGPPPRRFPWSADALESILQAPGS